MEELVSIIVPVYNSAKYIKKNIESILKQQYKNLEIIYIDDGSVDESYDILNKYANLDERIKLIKQNNHGVSFARNVGLNAAQGEFIVFIDSDDFIEECYVKALLQCIKKEHADIVCCTYMLHRPDKDVSFGKTEKQYIWNQKEGLEHLITGNLIEPGVCAKMFVRSILLDISFKTDVKYNEDYLFNLQVFANAQKIIYYDSAQYHYVLHENSATTSAPLLKSAQDMVLVSEIASSMKWDKKIEDALKRRRCLGYVSNYNFLLYGKGKDIEHFKDFLREKILKNKDYYKKGNVGNKNYFFYLGISYFPKVYKQIYLLLKHIMPDRRTFKI